MTHDLDAQLNNNDSLIIKAWPAPDLCSVLQQHAGRIAAMGKNVLVLDETYYGSSMDFGEVGSLFLRQVFQDRGDFTQGNGYSCSLWRFSELLRHNQERNWLQRLGLIIVPDGDRVFADPFEWELMAKRLRDRMVGGLPQFLVVAGERRSPEPSLRRILPVFDTKDQERTIIQSGPENIWWTIWTTQQSSEYALAHNAHRGLYCGIEPVLANHAGEKGVSSSLLQCHPSVAIVDHCESLQRELGYIHIKNDTDGGWRSATPTDRFVGAITLRDHTGNPWRVLHTSLVAGQQDILLNIVSRHTLLSAYQLANAAYFAHQPLDPLSPMVIDQDIFGTLVQLLLRIDKNDHFRLSWLQDTLNAAEIASKPERALLDFKHELLRHGISHAAESLAVNCSWDWHETRGGMDYGRIAYVSLGGHDVSIAELDWLREFQVQNQAGTVMRILRQDHVGQNYQSGKICVFDQKTYLVERIHWGNGKIIVSHNDSLPAPDYRDIRRVELLETIHEKSLLHGEEKQVSDLTISEKVYRAAFRVSTQGYYASPDHWFGPAAEKVLTETPDRDYPQGRVARLVFRTDTGSNLLPPGAAVALAQWLNEAAITFFPESHTCFLAVADVADAEYPSEEPASLITPRLTGEKFRQKDGSILIFEDSHSDLGLPRATILHWQYLLEVCSDHLTWLLEEASPETRIGDPSAIENTNLLIPARDFFAYGEKGRDSKIDLVALHDALSRIPELQSGHNLTKLRRRALEQTATFPLADENAQYGNEACDFCGSVVDEGEREVFPDGRVRCVTCSECGVDHVDQLPAMYKVAIDYFKNILNVEFAENVDVKLTTPIELANIQNTTFIPTSGFDSRAQGLAKARSHTGSILDETRHTILIESGFSLEETAGTLVHELTHIWQYNMLNYKKMNADHGALLIEGHAMWAERDFLYRAIEQLVIPGGNKKRLERAINLVEAMVTSDSEYGRGYRLVQQGMNNFYPSSRNPFKWLLQHYNN